MGSHIMVPAPDLTRFACLRVHVAHSTLRLSFQSAVHSASGCGHGGARNGSVANFDFRGKIRKSTLGNSMTYRHKNSRNSNFATEPFRLLNYPQAGGTRPNRPA